MFATTKKSVSMILGVALIAAAAFQAPAFAGEAGLSHNEIAAQSAIVGTVDNTPASIDASSATLARNEGLAQRVIVDVSTPSDRVGAIGEATLTQNEIAAQRAIVDTTVTNGTSRFASSAKTSVVSTRSPAQH